MPDDVVPEMILTVVEPWLLPEFKANHVVSPESKTPSLGGFSQKKSANFVDPSISQPMNRAMSAEQLAEIRLQAEQDGFQQGRASGYEKGYAEGEQRASVIVEQLAAEKLAGQQASLAGLIRSIVNPLSDQSDLLKQTLTQLVKAIAEQLCERELQADNSSIASVVNLAVDALPVTETDITLFLHPQDLATLELMDGFVQPEWQLCGRDTLQLGDCLIESENSLVDFRRSARFKTILDGLFPAAKR
tara:strand:+ start:175 stop:912 length:738 start_codon:yes stop_codon:yes gene_type:complete